MVIKKKWIIISGTFFALLVAVTFFLPLFFNYRFINHHHTHSGPVNAKDFFTQRYVSKEVGTHFPLAKNIAHEEWLANVTNYTSYATPALLKFDDVKIQTNIISLMKNTILRHQKFMSEKNLYLQVRYEKKDTKTLLLDVRWTDKISCSTFYFDKVKLNISKRKSVE